MGKRGLGTAVWWGERVREWRGSGWTVREFCRRRRLSEGAFHYWRNALARRVGERSSSGAKSAPDITLLAPDSASAAVANSRVAIAASSAGAQGVATSREAVVPLFAEVVVTPAVGGAAIEIVCGDSRRVLVATGFDRPTLRAVLEVLEQVEQSERSRC